jgi:hypothetical protein
VGTYAASAASPSITQVVNQDLTAAAVTSSSNPSVAGQLVTYTTIVTAASPGTGNPTGGVEFFDGATGISGCTAKVLPGTSTDLVTCVVPYANTVGGSHSITVQYLCETSTYSARTSAVLSQVVNQAATTTSVVSSPSPSVVGQSVTYVATVTVNSPGTGNPTGSVEFFDGGTAITVCGGTTGLTLGGSDTANCAVTYTSAGGRTIIAKYLGNAGTYAVSSLSSSITQTVSASSAVTGNSTGNLVTGTDYYQLPSASAGSATSTHNSFSAGTATTLTSFTFTISVVTAATRTATGLSCSMTGGSGLKTGTIDLSVPIPGAYSVNLQVGGGGATAVTGTWTSTYTQPWVKVE